MNAKLLAKEPRPFAVAKGRCFIDTNVLVYAHANDEALKQSRALALIGQLHAAARAVVSTQVLQEFCNVGLKKLGLTSAQLQDQLHFLRQLEVVLITPDMLNQALGLHQMHQVSFYDALIVIAAQASHCTTIYSEDFNAGQVLAGAKVINPFAGLT
jgi:predicted nucleic acid-binding protein